MRFFSLFFFGFYLALPPLSRLPQARSITICYTPPFSSPRLYFSRPSLLFPFGASCCSRFLASRVCAASPVSCVFLFFSLTKRESTSKRREERETKRQALPQPHTHHPDSLGCLLVHPYVPVRVWACVWACVGDGLVFPLFLSPAFAGSLFVDVRLRCLLRRFSKAGVQSIRASEDALSKKCRLRAAGRGRH